MALRAGWWLLAVGALLGGSAALVYCLTATPVYSAQTQFFIATTESSDNSEALQGSQFSQQRVASYAQLLTGDDFVGRVIDRLGLDEAPEELGGRITATTVADTVLINVSVDDPSAERAQAIAEAVGEEFTTLVAELETPGGDGRSPVAVTVTDQPELPSSPSRPDVPRTLAVGTLGGLLLGGIVAVLRQLRRQRGAGESGPSFAQRPLDGRSPGSRSKHRRADDGVGFRTP